MSMCYLWLLLVYFEFTIQKYALLPGVLKGGSRLYLRSLARNFGNFVHYFSSAFYLYFLQCTTSKK